MVQNNKKMGLAPKSAKFFLTFGYTGLFPVMPGTIGSIAALFPVMILNYFLSYWPAQIILGIGIVVGFFLGVWVCRKYAYPLFESEDPSPVVIDEVVGIWIATWLWDFPLNSYPGDGDWTMKMGEIAAAFLLFRLFDITKVFGIRRLEKIPGGWGVMLDDLAAGLLAFGLIRLYEIFW